MTIVRPTVEITYVGNSVSVQTRFVHSSGLVCAAESSALLPLAFDFEAVLVVLRALHADAVAKIQDQSDRIDQGEREAERLANLSSSSRE